MTLAYLLAAADSSDDVPARNTNHHPRTKSGVPESNAQELLARLQSDHAAAIPALEDIITQYTRPLLRFARSFPWENAEDLVQEVLIDLWDSRTRLQIRGSLRGYLFGAVRRKALFKKRHDEVVQRMAHSMDRRAAAESLPGLGTAPSTPEVSLQDTELRRAVAHALAQLPERTRTVLTLRWVHDLTYPEIANAIGISLDAAKKQGQRGERALQPMLERFRLES